MMTVVYCRREGSQTQTTIREYRGSLCQHVIRGHSSIRLAWQVCHWQALLGGRSSSWIQRCMWHSVRLLRQRVSQIQQQQQPFYGPFRPGLPRWASTRRNTHPPTVLIIIQFLISFFHLPRSIASSLFKLRAWQSFCTTSLHVQIFRIFAKEYGKCWLSKLHKVEKVYKFKRRWILWFCAVLNIELLRGVCVCGQKIGSV